MKDFCVERRPLIGPPIVFEVSIHSMDSIPLVQQRIEEEKNVKDKT